ncbi:MAG: hypothetical protein ACYCO3_15880 [Mycobacteriales bacterium]
MSQSVDSRATSVRPLSTSACASPRPVVCRYRFGLIDKCMRKLAAGISIVTDDEHQLPSGTETATPYDFRDSPLLTRLEPGQSVTTAWGARLT